MMRPTFARAKLQLIDHLECDTPYVYITVSTGVNNSLKDILEKRPFIDCVRYQVHEFTRDNVAIVVKHADGTLSADILDSTMKAIKLWHEIETGWLNCTPPIEIYIEERARIIKELFEPQEGSFGHELGRILAKKDWAMLEERYDLAREYGRLEVPYWQKLMSL